MKIKIPKILVKLTGNIYLHKYPMFIVYKPDQHRLKGDKIREILNGMDIYLQAKPIIPLYPNPGFNFDIGLGVRFQL